MEANKGKLSPWWPERRYTIKTTTVHFLSAQSYAIAQRRLCDQDQSHTNQKISSLVKLNGVDNTLAKTVPFVKHKPSRPYVIPEIKTKPNMFWQRCLRITWVTAEKMPWWTQKRSVGKHSGIKEGQPRLTMNPTTGRQHRQAVSKHNTKLDSVRRHQNPKLCSYLEWSINQHTEDRQTYSLSIPQQNAGDWGELSLWALSVCHYTLMHTLMCKASGGLWIPLHKKLCAQIHMHARTHTKGIWWMTMAGVPHLRSCERVPELALG